MSITQAGSSEPLATKHSRQFSELPPLSLYVHLPWCVKKCPYCDFNSHEYSSFEKATSGAASPLISAQSNSKPSIPEQAYVDALLNDLATEMPRVWGRTVSTVFIGGGTPSLFSAKALDQLLSGIRALTALSPSAEITMEANPGTFEQEKFKDFRALGINRLSIGIQSFNDKSLSILGRIHGGDEARQAVGIAHQAGFDNLNLDLMFGLPQQSMAEAMADVQQAINLNPTHISYYELTLEPNTLFAKYPPALPDADDRWDIHVAGMETLAKHGFHRYEISAFAQTNKQAAHNVNYWQFGDYLGIGAGAHSKISFADTGHIVRRWKHKHPDKYMRTAGSDACIGADTLIPLVDTALEFMMNALRLVDGFAIPEFELNTGLSLERWQPNIDQAIQAGLLEQVGLRLKPSTTGLNYLNDLLGYFLPSEPSVRRYPIVPLIQQ